MNECLKMTGAIAAEAPAPAAGYSQVDEDGDYTDMMTSWSLWFIMIWINIIWLTSVEFLKFCPFTCAFPVISCKVYS